MTTTDSLTAAIAVSVVLVVAIVCAGIAFAVLTLRRERPVTSAQVTSLRAQHEHEKTPKAA